MTTQLYAVIKHHAESNAKAGKWSAVAATLNVPSVDVRITELRSTRWLIQTFDAVIDPATGATEADLILGTMQAADNPRVKAVLQSGGDGIDLSDPQSQQLITALAKAGNWPPGLVAKIKAAAFDSRSLAQMAGLPPVTAADAESHWKAGQAVEAGSVTYDNRRILLCLNDGPVNDSLTIRYTPVGVVDGVEVKGASTNSGGVSSGLKGRDKALYADLLAAVAKWEGS